MATKEALKIMCVEYEKLRNQESKIKKAKDEISTQIKAAFGDKEDLPVPDFILSYHYDDDKTSYTVDYEEFQKAEPKVYKKWVHEETVPGSRRLMVKRIEEK